MFSCGKFVSIHSSSKPYSILTNVSFVAVVIWRPFVLWIVQSLAAEVDERKWIPGGWLSIVDVILVII